MNSCNICGSAPLLADVGGVIPYYEISCPCGQSAVVGAHSKEEAIITWNIINGRSE
jgi:hypothetical protein